MKFIKTKLAGVFEVRLEPIPDERGFFARTWCEKEFQSHGLNSSIAQCSVSFNNRKGTLRGMHYQASPFAETKTIRCNKGAIFDVVLDLRSESLTFKSWIGVELTAENRKMLYVPEGCAHGFLTLENDTEIFYQISEFYNAESARGVRWDDPAFCIEWPMRPEVMSERDRTYADVKPEHLLSLPSKSQ
jgi:dTDP-4-dehydrorhamnose 3,5-epimerase